MTIITQTTSLRSPHRQFTTYSCRLSCIHLWKPQSFVFWGFGKLIWTINFIPSVSTLVATVPLTTGSNRLGSLFLRLSSHKSLNVITETVLIPLISPEKCQRITPRSATQCTALRKSQIRVSRLTRFSWIYKQADSPAADELCSQPCCKPLLPLVQPVLLSQRRNLSLPMSEIQCTRCKTSTTRKICHAFAWIQLFFFFLLSFLYSLSMKRFLSLRFLSNTNRSPVIKHAGWLSC